jgi:hypothetical protein
MVFSAAQDVHMGGGEESIKESVPIWSSTLGLETKKEVGLKGRSVREVLKFGYQNRIE